MSDLISRSALIEAMEKRYQVAEKKAFYSVGLSEGFIVCEEIIKEQPTVEAKPVVRGEWIDTQPDYHPGCGNNAHVCSVCGDYYTTEPEDLFFCPRCGADMRGGKNEDNI